MKGASYDTIPRISESSRRMDGKRQGMAACPESPDLVYCPNAREEDDHILFGGGGGAGLLGGEGDETRKASSCAVPFLFVGLAAADVLQMARQSCAANERSGRGKRTGIYIPRRSFERA